MSEVKTTVSRCKSCGFCVKNCPRKAITLSKDFNSGGYKYAVIDREACIVCGICYTVCPDGVFEVIA